MKALDPKDPLSSLIPHPSSLEELLRVVLNFFY